MFLCVMDYVTHYIYNYYKPLFHGSSCDIVLASLLTNSNMIFKGATFDLKHRQNINKKLVNLPSLLLWLQKH